VHGVFTNILRLFYPILPIFAMFPILFLSSVSRSRSPIPHEKLQSFLPSGLLVHREFFAINSIS